LGSNAVSCVRLLARSSLIALLAAGLANLPVMAASARPLGSVVTAQNARLDNVTAAIGASVYSGDAMATDQGGSLRLALGASQIYLLGDTSATLAPQATGVRATVDHGTLGFQTSTPGQFGIETPFGLVHGADGKEIFGQLTVLSPVKMRISAYEGTLLVDGRDGEEKTIAKGETYEVTLDAEPSGGGGTPQVAITGARFNWKHVLDVAIPAAILGGTAAVVYHFATESDSTTSSN
jgi:hypothetical protein